MNNDTLYQNFDFKAYNTFGIDVKVNYFLPYSSEKTLLRFLPEINEFGLQPLMVGEGSNLLFLKNYDGIILYSQIKGIEIIEENESDVFVRVGAGEIWDDFVQWAVNNNYGGVENLSIIPGTVGASPVQNIGAYGVEAKDVIVKAETIELATKQKRTFTNEECQFAYRNSIFKNELKGQFAVTYVIFKLSKNPVFNLSYGNIDKLIGNRTPSLQLVREIICEVRNSKLPDYKILGNAGSFFTNPYVSKEKYDELLTQYPNMPHYPIDDTQVKVPAGWLIDQCGLKGFEHNGAAVHKDQALVIVNTGNATGMDVSELADIIIEKVREKYGIELKPEVNFID